ncbi:MAG: hypothetical protein ACYCYR_01505 [Desulfobulbaceae bacterium]
MMCVIHAAGVASTWGCFAAGLFLMLGSAAYDRIASSGQSEHEILFLWA